MVLRHHYTHPTTPAGPGFDITLGDVVKLGEDRDYGVVAAVMGAEQTTVTVDDLAGTADFKGLYGWHLHEDTCRPQLTLTGTLTMGTASTTVTGSGTDFTNELREGDVVYLAAGTATTAYVTVSSVTSGTAFVARKAPDYAASGTATRADDQQVWTGYIGNQTIGRHGGGEEEYYGSVARGWTLDLAEANSIFDFRVCTGTASNRPAESPTARLTWALTTEFVPLVDAGLINWTSLGTATNMDAVDYRGQRGSQVYADLVLKMGWTCWCRFRPGANDFELWFDDPNTSTKDNGFISISNDPADFDDYSQAPPYSVIPASMDATLSRDPSRIAAGVYAEFSGTATAGSATAHAVYVYDYSTSYAYAFRDQTTSLPNVKTVAQGSAIAQRFLNQNNEPSLLIKDRIVLPASQLNDVKAGQLIPAKYTHLPGMETFRNCRVTKKSFSQPENRAQDIYVVDLELVPLALPVGNFLVAIVSTGKVDTPSNPTDLSTHLWTVAGWVEVPVNGSQNPGPGGPSGIGVYYRPIVAGESATVLRMEARTHNNLGAWVLEVGGADVNTLSVISGTDSVAGLGATATVSTTAGAASVLFGVEGLQKVDYGQITKITTTEGTRVFQGNLKGEDSTSGTCGVDGDPYPPYTWIGYDTGSGSLAFGGTIACTGATPDYNVMGRGWVAILAQTPGAFSIVQQAQNYVLTPGGILTVTLPAPPTAP